jgi:hypothetical protein
MSSPETIGRGDASAKPTRWSPGNVSKNQLYESSKRVGNPSDGFVQSGEKFGCIHEGNTEAAPKSFRKKTRSGGFLAAESQKTAVWRPPLLGCRRWPLQLKHQCEAAQLARDAAQFDRPFG